MWEASEETILHQEHNQIKKSMNGREKITKYSTKNYREKKTEKEELIEEGMEEEINERHMKTNELESNLKILFNE